MCFTLAQEMKNSHRNAIIGWLIAGGLGFIANLAWFVIITKGDFSGMGLAVFYIFSLYYILGHVCIFLPIFLIFWKNTTSKFWRFRYMIPIGFLIGFCASIIIKGEPISELYVIIMSIKLGLYGCMIAGSYVFSYKLANKPRHATTTSRPV